MTIAIATIILGLIWYMFARSALSTARAASYRRSHYHMLYTRSKMSVWQAGNAPIDYNNLAETAVRGER